MARPKGSGGQAAALTKEQIGLVADELARDPEHGERNRTIWLLGVLTACRVSEVLELRVQDVWACGNYAHTGPLSQVFLDSTRTKTRTSCTIPLCRVARDLIVRWMLRRGPVAPGDFLFPGRYPGNPLSYDAFREALVEARERLGLVRVRTHSMRRTSATLAYAKDRDIRKLQKKLRHKSLSATGSYVEVTDREMAEHADLLGDDLAEIAS